MGSSSSKGASSCSSSSSCSLRKNRSKRHRGFPSYCLGTTSGSRDSDNDEQVCDQNKVNGSDVTYTSSNEIDSDEAKSESFRKVKPDEIPCMTSNIDLDEWSHTESRTSSIPAHASLTQSTNSMSQFLSRFSLIPDEKETRAWTILEGMNAPQAAGVIHSDFEKGFIRAKTMAYNDFVAAGSLAVAREKGILRSEGKACCQNKTRCQDLACLGWLPHPFIDPAKTPKKQFIKNPVHYCHNRKRKLISNSF
ncbi:hypothetical protein RYX36_022338 [Vicia faba]